MTGVNQQSDKQFRKIEGQQAKNNSHSEVNRHTDEQLQRWAMLISKGETEFPDDLDPGDTDLLVCYCRKLLRNRLIKIIARNIAAEIHRENEHLYRD